MLCLRGALAHFLELALASLTCTGPTDHNLKELGSTQTDQEMSSNALRNH